MTLLTERELEQMEALEKAATEGPWHIGHVDEALDHAEIDAPDGGTVATVYPRSAQAFVAASRSFVPRAIATIRKLAVELGMGPDLVGSLERANSRLLVERDAARAEVNRLRVALGAVRSLTCGRDGAAYQAWDIANTTLQLHARAALEKPE
jgi:hypothetical protein